MFLKGKNKDRSAQDRVFMNLEPDDDDIDIVDLNEQRDVDIESLFKASSFDTSHPGKIIIRDVEKKRSSFWADLDAEDDDIEEKPKKKKDFHLFGLRKYKPIEEHRLEYVPLASEIDNKNTGSDFRRQSADWMDKDYSAEYGGYDAADSDDKSFLGVLGSASILEWTAAVLAVVILISGVMTANVCALAKCSDRRIEAISKLKAFEASKAEEIAQEVETIEAPVITANVEPQESKVLSLILSSVEKDLKIKLVDEEDTLVKDIDWSVNVTDNDGEVTEESDDDRDGIIHMTEMSAGDYSVELIPTKSLAEFELPRGAQSVSVKAKVEYKVIANIKEEIKTEKEINAAVEDNGNKPADVEQTVATQDTVEWLESTKTAAGERYEEAEVDIEETGKDTSQNKLFALLDGIKSVANASFGRYSTVAYPLILAPEGEEVKCPPHTYENYICKDCGAEDPDKPCSHEYENYICKKCGAEDPDKPCSHEWGSPVIASDNTHTVTCTICGETESKSCDFSSGNCPCGNKKPAFNDPVPEHTLSYNPNGNGTHNIVCSVSGCTEHNKTNVACEWDSSGKCTNNCGNTKPATAQEYTVVVENGKGSGKYKVGADVIVKASVPSGQKFEKWVATGIALNDGQIESSKITFKMPSADVTLKPVFTVEEQLYADSAQLYDSKMNALYVDDNGVYRLAKYIDYKNDKTQKFFRKLEEYIYTGWQTIDGKRYYYNRDNEPVTGDQVIGGVQYHFGTDGVLSMGSGKLGIDVSKYQPSINWSSVKRSGIDYVIIRCGYRGSSTGVLVEDPYFRSHIKGAKAAGLKVGVYFFTTAVSEAEAVEEASMVAYLCGGYGIDYPVFMDCESSPRAGYNGMSASQRTAIIKAFCNTLRSAGYTPGVYANKTWLSSYMNVGELSGFKIWLAQYNSAGPTYSGRYDLWQYTSKGRVDGISGNVDMNQSYLGY